MKRSFGLVRGAHYLHARSPERVLMAHCFGDRERFAVEVGPALGESRLRVVDLWVAGVELCCDDNQAFVPQFGFSMEREITRLLSDNDRSLPHLELSPEENHRRLWAGGDYDPYTFMDWGPTTDNLLALLFRCGPTAIITVEFCRRSHPRPDELGRVFVAELPEREVLRALHQAVCVLRSGA